MTAGPQPQKSESAKRDLVTGATYDETPYESYIYPSTHPESQALAARITGFAAPDLYKARVLELGCAGGGNILPLACDFPKAEFVGIDLSPVQIEEAENHRKNLGLSNITFKAMDIMDIGPDFGRFDYIICHGVVSWVPDFVRSKIFAVCRENLTDQGLACLTHNVMPGWGPLKTVREMMILHTKKFTRQEEKIAHAKGLIAFLADSMSPSAALHQTVLNIQKKFQETKNDTYILHEYLEPNNHPLYFAEFAEMLAQNKLSYVGDTMLSMMHAANFGEKAGTTLAQIKDMQAREQYIDFISGRQFRYSVVTKSENKAASADLGMLKNFYFGTNLKIMEANTTTGEILCTLPGKDGVFRFQDGPVRAIIESLSQRRMFLVSFPEIAQTLQDFTKQDQAGAEKLALSTLLNLILRGIIYPRLHHPAQKQAISDKPEAHPFARYQAATSSRVIFNTGYAAVTLTPLERFVIQYLDGKTPLEALTQRVAEEIEKSGKNISHNSFLTPEQKNNPTETISLAIENISKKSLLIS